MERENTGTNTVLIVVVLLILVGGGIWLFGNANNTTREAQTDRLEVDVTVPTNGPQGSQN